MGHKTLRPVLHYRYQCYRCWRYPSGRNCAPGHFPQDAHLGPHKDGHLEAHQNALALNYRELPHGRIDRQMCHRYAGARCAHRPQVHSYRSVARNHAHQLRVRRGFCLHQLRHFCRDQKAYLNYWSDQLNRANTAKNRANLMMHWVDWLKNFVDWLKNCVDCAPGRQ